MTYTGLLEWAEASRWAGISLDRFFELDENFMNYTVAAFRTSNQIQSVLEHERAREIKRDAQKPPKGGSARRGRRNTNR